ncbi:protein kinase [Nocardia sp. NPDC005978]|uniref:serine/threonine-protein kinase n=1 Tax=Nocardia sp. NPDC005978 TaxID=3156725 RepID=UPI00339DBA42
MPAGARAGSRFGQYELRRLLGVGGMGEVYEAYDTVRDRVVALKLLAVELAGSPTYVERFRRESRTAARLQEPHVIPVHDWGEVDGVLYIDMRLVRGRDLKAHLHERGPLTPAQAVAVVEQIAAALDAAHESGLVHRDIKPANILLTGDFFAYLVDFGIAHTDSDAQLTVTGSAIGSFAYMAPERFEHDAAVTTSADIYALACVLYESLTGRIPFTTDSNLATIRAHMLTPPPRPSHRPGVPASFDRVIATGMAKDVPDRYISAGQLARAARAALLGADPGDATRATPPGPPPAPPRAHPTRVQDPSGPFATPTGVRPAGAGTAGAGTASAGTASAGTAGAGAAGAAPAGVGPAGSRPAGVGSAGSGPTGGGPAGSGPTGGGPAGSGPVAGGPEGFRPGGVDHTPRPGAGRAPGARDSPERPGAGPVRGSDALGRQPAAAEQVPGPAGYGPPPGGVGRITRQGGAAGSEFGGQPARSGEYRTPPGDYARSDTRSAPAPGGAPARAPGEYDVTLHRASGYSAPIPLARPEHPSAPLPLPPRERGSMPLIVGMLAAVVVLLLAAVGWLLLSGGGDGPGGSGGTSEIAQPGQSTGPGRPTAVVPTTLAPFTGSVSGSDAQGFVGTAGARCNADNPAMAVGRTASSRIVVCRTGAGRFYYKGVRISDGAGIALDDPVPDGSGGYTVVNPVDDTRYRITPSALTISRDGATLADEAMIEYSYRG